MKTISLHVHSFSLRYHFRHAALVPGGYDVFRYMDTMRAAGFTGVNISANGPGYRDLGGTGDRHFAAVDARRRALGLKLELDTSDTRPENMRRMIAVTAACGGDTLRTYTRYRGTRAELMARTVEDLAAIADEADAAGVTIVLENHEDFQGPEIAAILDRVAHPRIRALYDYGNSQMVGEDPLAALEAMIGHTHCCHIKDHRMVRTSDGDVVVQGVAIGDGDLPILALTDRLYAAGLRRFCFENVWGYVAALKSPPDRLPGTPCFRLHGAGEHNVSDTLDPAAAIRGEAAAFDRGLAWFRTILADGGYRVAAEA